MREEERRKFFTHGGETLAQAAWRSCRCPYKHMEVFKAWWMEPWIVWYSEWQLCPWQGIGMRLFLPTYAILWFNNQSIFFVFEFLIDAILWLSLLYWPVTATASGILVHILLFGVLKGNGRRPNRDPWFLFFSCQFNLSGKTLTRCWRVAGCSKEGSKIQREKITNMAF